MLIQRRTFDLRATQTLTTSSSTQAEPPLVRPAVRMRSRVSDLSQRQGRVSHRIRSLTPRAARAKSASATSARGESSGGPDRQLYSWP